ncbi:hypothetical protein D9757_000764 [Collybiopsis confluens]|uniref:Xylanolytic transcriptional activator regulatory domain-containing protein n=1 Tax=Collybiopsis confluens TaxID=2823264 RepID=A0A8H5I169_9AGAR|nr:hypothetical protein D9757_000764 [Collybiopsis confluens]
MSSDEAELDTPIRIGWKKRRLQVRLLGFQSSYSNRNHPHRVHAMLAVSISNLTPFPSTHSLFQPARTVIALTNGAVTVQIVLHLEWNVGIRNQNEDLRAQSLERRLKSMEDMLRKFDVNIDDLNGQQQQQSPSHLIANSSSSITASIPSYSGVPSSISSNPGYPSLSAESQDSDLQTREQSEEDEDFAHVALADHLSKLSLNTVQRRFFGPSSAFMIMKNAHKVKEQTLGFETQPLKRPQYWGIQAWEKQFTDREMPVYIFPDNDLTFSLISIYFAEVNIFLPILHRPTFNQYVSDGLHYRNPHFGATLLLVCAVASRYSKDPRVFAHPGSELSCGWHYYEQVQTIRKSLFEPPTLFELQFYCSGHQLSTIYMLGTSSPSSAWTLVAVGIRFALEMGVHRRQPDSYKWTSLDEQKRRAFWVLVSLDRLLSSFVGRPASVRDEDFDVEPPLECDDEYWEDLDHPERSFRQPSDRPAIISCFKSHLRLVEILAFSLRTLYSSRRSKLLLGLVGEEWDQKILKEIDAALHKWFTSVPEHSKYCPLSAIGIFILNVLSRANSVQSHRPFLQKASEKSFHSLAICTNAARSTSHILDVHVSHGIIALPHILYASYISAMVIMLNLWGTKRAGIRIDHQKEIESASKMMEILRQCDQRWNIAGRFWDMLAELVRDFDVPHHYSPPSHNADHSINLASSGAHRPDSSTSYRGLNAKYQPQPQSTYQSQSYAPGYNQSSITVSADSQLASQLMYGWKSSPENSPAWTNKQSVESLASIDKKTIAYLEQIFGKIENLPEGPAPAPYHDNSQEKYPTSNEGIASYSSQLQPGYNNPMDMAGQNDNLWTSAPHGFE